MKDIVFIEIGRKILVLCYLKGSKKRLGVTANALVGIQHACRLRLSKASCMADTDAIILCIDALIHMRNQPRLIHIKAPYRLPKSSACRIVICPHPLLPLRRYFPLLYHNSIAKAKTPSSLLTCLQFMKMLCISLSKCGIIMFVLTIL